ncbi:MAG: ATP-binding protein [Bacteroidota bacterium]|jgi:anti-sigma regulatory factor (Ser/Thr protein kinase)
MHFEYQIEGGDFSTAGTISSNVKKFLKQLNVDGSIIKRTVVALYEAEVNVVAHAFSGIVEVDYFEDKIQIKLIDKGPGISDINRAMQAGFSTASPAVREMGFGAGMGLPNIKNNTDELNIKSEVGVGTTLLMVNFFQNKLSS